MCGAVPSASADRIVLLTVAARAAGQAEPTPAQLAEAAREAFGYGPVPAGAAELLSEAGLCPECLAEVELCHCCRCVCFCPSGVPLGTEGRACHCLPDPRCPEHGSPWPP